MNSFSIAQLQQYSGIKAHTIRIWEQRYNALSPQRSEGNTRNYDNTQLRRLLNIVSLMDAGFKVSKLCKMSDEQLFELLEKRIGEAPAIDRTFDYYIVQLLAAGMAFNQEEFEKVFANCLFRFGMKNTYVEVIYPMLNRIGMMWTSDTMPPAQEHFMTNILRQKMLSAIDALAVPDASEKTWLLFLPEDEFHEMGLLMAQFILREANQKVIYLGSNVPFQALQDSVAATKPDYLLSFWVHNNTPESCQQYLDTLSSSFPQTNICIAGPEAVSNQVKAASSIQWLPSIPALEKLIG